MGRHLLLVVEDTLLLAARRRLMVAPFLDASVLPAGEFTVELQPDGSSASVRAVAIVPFAVGPPREARAHLALMGVAKEDVPIGTAVWTVE